MTDHADSFRGRVLGAFMLLGAIGTAVGGFYAVDSFYVRSAQYKADRDDSTKATEKAAHEVANQFEIGRLSSEISNLETRQAFTRYRMNDAMNKTNRNAIENNTLLEYRSDLFGIARELDGKKRLIDQLRAGRAP